MKTWKKWSDGDFKILGELYGKVAPPVIAKRLGRTRCSVCSQYSRSDWRYRSQTKGGTDK